MKLPQDFNLIINLKHAVGNAAGVILFLLIMGLTKPLVLGAGLIFGLCGGSINDIVAWVRNRTANQDTSDKGGQ